VLVHVRTLAAEGKESFVRHGIGIVDVVTDALVI
jgi:hypothetical protein